MCRTRNCKQQSLFECLHVHQYSLDNLIVELSEASFSDIIKNKLHIQFLSNYLEKIETKIFIVEDVYVDKDFLEDHSLYYARCFKNYNRLCKRIHFFSNNYTEAELREIFFGTDVHEDVVHKFQESYLGFSVIKPLPRTIIGRTCLKTYSETDGRNYLTIRTFHANLFGIDLTVKTLPFQEQDSVVAACATSALWSAFQMTGDLFGHKILSPSKITQYAVENRICRSRPFPNTLGLTVEQMAHAIFKVELEPLCLDIKPTKMGKEIFLGNLYAYTKFSIPVLLVVDLYDESTNSIMGRHAITIAGFNTNGTAEQATLPLFSDKINKLYGHDDQIGPFTRIEYDASLGKWYSSWKAQNNPDAKVEIQPQLLLIPIYHKIRIPFETIWFHIYRFHQELSFLKNCFPSHKQILFDEIKWDIYLISNNDLKKKWRREKFIDAELRKDLLTTMLPKYLWSATVYRGEIQLSTFIFDATDIEQGLSVLKKISYDLEFNNMLKTFASIIKNSKSIVLSSYDE